MQVEDDVDLHEGQRSTEVSIINNALWLPNLVRRTTDVSLGWWRASWRSKVFKVTYSKQWSVATKLKRMANVSLGWWWSKWRSKVNRSIIVNNDLWLPNLEEPLMQVQNYDDLYRGQGSNGVKCSKLCSVATKLGQKITNDNDDLHIGQRTGQEKSNVVYISKLYALHLWYLVSGWVGLRAKSVHVPFWVWYKLKGYWIRGILHDFHSFSGKALTL